VATPRARLADVGVALAVGIAIGLAIAAVSERLDRGRTVRVSHVATTHAETRLIGPADVPFVLHRLEHESRGGIVRVEWYDGAWAPRAPESGCYVSLFVDGERIAGTLLGGRRGVNETRPGSLVWVGELPSGRRTLEIRVERVDEGFALPEATAETPVQDGLLVLEWS
jgi:hypothetical protein